MFRGLYLALSFTFMVMHGTSAMNGELRIYKEPDFKRLRRIIGVSTTNLCYDMSCSELNDITLSAKWTGLLTDGSAFSDGQVKIAFYAGANCTGEAAVLNTSRGRIHNFAEIGMNKTITSFAVLETSTTMLHGTSKVCEW
ncbi:unnamed protein product [Phytophthora lilii]|uniref:Unnamed protein product n=1 Tax=Phytophthora lilii TaxID=2077276 RepID=A0A9W6WG69_9STRA|nr:unnamed protein product [Phytophthora lilii]